MLRPDVRLALTSSSSPARCGARGDSVGDPAAVAPLGAAAGYSRLVACSRNGDEAH